MKSNKKGLLGRFFDFLSVASAYALVFSILLSLVIDSALLKSATQITGLFLIAMAIRWAVEEKAKMFLRIATLMISVVVVIGIYSKLPKQAAQPNQQTPPTAQFEAMPTLAIPPAGLELPGISVSTATPEPEIQAFIVGDCGDVQTYAAYHTFSITGMDLTLETEENRVMLMRNGVAVKEIGYFDGNAGIRDTATSYFFPVSNVTTKLLVFQFPNSIFAVLRFPKNDLDMNNATWTVLQQLPDC